MNKEQKNAITPHRSSFLPYDPIVLVRDIARRWLLILTAVVVLSSAAYIYFDASYKPQYTTNATVVVTARDSDGTVFSNLSSATTLANVFKTLLSSSAMQNIILEEVGIPDFSGSIRATAVSDTNLIVLNVTADDPKTAFLVIRAVLEHHHVITSEVVGNIVVETLVLPTVPTAPSNTVGIASRLKWTVLLSTLGMCGFIGLCSYLRDSIRSREEAESKLNCWCLGEIRHERVYRSVHDLLHRRRQALVITNPAITFRFTETFSRLRRRVEQNMGTGRVLMVTSVMENEGKSTVSVNLALALAKKHDRVLLIDFDLNKPACYKILGMHAAPNAVRDTISGTAVLDGGIRVDPMSGLHVLMQAAAEADPAVLLSSEGTKRLLTQARANYDYIVLDLSPMAAAPDAEILSELADAALLVVQQNRCRASSVNRAISALTREGGASAVRRRRGVRLLGCVVNNVYTSALTERGSYGYGGRYRKYGAYGSYGRRGTADSRGEGMT